jgi:hypothetical protein
MMKYFILIENTMIKNPNKPQSEGDITEIIEMLKFLNYDGTVSFHDIDSTMAVQ